VSKDCEELRVALPKKSFVCADSEKLVGSDLGMFKVIYLVNQYPSPSHTFIREEARALERLGLQVLRVAIRRNPMELIDERDRQERQKTEYILGRHFFILSSFFSCAAHHPVRLFKAAVRTASLALRAKSKVGAHLFYLLEACALAVIAKRNGVKHIHAHFGTNSAAVALLASTISSVPFSFTVHGPDEFDQPIQLSLDTKIACAKFTAAISDFTRSQLLRWAPHSEWSNIHVVRCGLSPEYISSVPETADASAIFVSVGRLTPQKGQALLIEAFRSVAACRPDSKLWIVGDGELRPELEALISEYNLGSCVELKGWMTGADIRACLNASRAFVMSSFAEGLPVAIMEAMAHRRPVISTNVAGIAELVVDNTNGWLIPAGTQDQLTAAMIRALDLSDEEIKAMGQRGRELAVERHDPDRNAKQLHLLITG
jgi:colanic acid/amylovoran biosynthesis glycosyltransferase